MIITDQLTIETTLRILGWSGVALGGGLFVHAFDRFQNDDAGLGIVTGLAGAGAVYWGYLLLLPTPDDPDDDVQYPDADEWGW